MSVYIRRVGEVADGAVTNIKLAENAVDLNSNKVTGELPSAKLANGAVIEDKIAALAISTGKLKDQAVSLAKAQQALKIHHFTGDETEVSVTGIVEEEVKTFKLVKSSANTKGIQAQRLHINVEIKTSDVTAQGTLKLYMDAEETPRLTVNTSSLTYEMQEDDADISDLTNGSHEAHIKMVSAVAAKTVYNDLIEIFFEK